MNLHVANLETAEKRSFDHGQMNVATLGETVIGRAVFNPGWKWSIDVKPSAGTSSCQVAHAGVVLSGRFHIRMDDGTETELGPGDAHVVAPGHDAWVVGDEQCVIVDVGVIQSPASNTPEGVVHSYFDAFNAARVDETVALFSDDANIMADGMPTTGGREQFASVFEGFFAAMDVQEHEEVDSVTDSGDLAVVRTHSTGTVTVRQSGETTSLELRELFVLRRTAGRWLISEYIFNSPVVAGR